MLFVEHFETNPAQLLPRVHVRFGIDIGFVYAGLTGGESRNEWTCLGDAVNIASRLMQEARWDEALVSARVREAGTQHFDFRPFGERLLKGRTKPEPLFLARESIPASESGARPSRNWRARLLWLENRTMPCSQPMSLSIWRTCFAVAESPHGRCRPFTRPLRWPNRPAIRMASSTRSTS